MPTTCGSVLEVAELRGPQVIWCMYWWQFVLFEQELLSLNSLNFSPSYLSRRLVSVLCTVYCRYCNRK